MKKTIRSQTVFYGIAKYTNVLVTLLTTSVLARLLTPEAFGTVSVVTVFTAFFTILSDMGLGAAVIQNKTLENGEINDIFSFSVYIALGLGAAFALLGGPVAYFYGDPVYHRVCLLLSLSVFFNAANTIPNAVLMKHKLFASVGIRLIFTAVLSGILAVILALQGFGCYALIVQSIFQAVFIFVWNQSRIHLCFHFRFRGASIRKVRQYSTYQFFYSLINYFARNLDNLLIGKTMGSVSLAYYDKGYRLMMYPVQNLTYVINPIIHPVLSEYQTQKEFIFTSYLKITKILSILGMWISAVCCCCSEEIILFFFGSQWQESVPVFRLLSISVWPQIICASAGSIYQSLGNTRLMFQSGMVHFGAAIVLILIGVSTGSLVAVSALVCLGLYLRFMIDYYFLVVHGFGIRYGRFLRVFQKELLMALVLIPAVLILHRVPIQNPFCSLVFKGSCVSAIYAVLLAVTRQMGVIRSILRK